MEETDYLGSTTIPSDDYFEPTKYRVKCRCLRCGHVYARTFKVIPKENPPCPKKKCREAIAAEQAAKQEENLQEIIETGETPAQIGANVRVKAVDETAKIVMEDYQMTDLKDNTRTGDTMVPALTPRQRAMSENFWGGGRLSDRRRNPTYQMGVQENNKRLIDNAMSGAFLPDMRSAVPRDSVTGDNMLSHLHANRIKPNVTIIADANRKPKGK